MIQAFTKLIYKKIILTPLSLRSVSWRRSNRYSPSYSY